MQTYRKKTRQGNICSVVVSCRINAAFETSAERRIHAAAKNSVMRPLAMLFALETEARFPDLKFGI